MNSLGHPRPETFMGSRAIMFCSHRTGGRRHSSGTFTPRSVNEHHEAATFLSLIPSREFPLAEQIVPSGYSPRLLKPVERRARLYLMIVGTVLTGINHGDGLLRGDVDGRRLS